MTRRRWYFYSLMIPFLFPVLLMAAAGMTHRFMKADSLMGWLSLLSLIQIVGGGVQYAMFIYIVYLWGRDKPVAQIRRVSWVLPLWFWPWCTVWFLVPVAFVGHVRIFIVAGLFSLPFAYFYVLLAHLMTWGLVKAKWVRD